MKSIAYYNGKTGAPEEMTIPMLDRVCYFGDGVYDATMAAGNTIFLLDEHVDRLYHSAGLIDIQINMTKEELKAILQDMISRTDNRYSFVYFQFTRATAPRSHACPKGFSPNLWITVTPKVFRDFSQPMKLTSMEDQRYLYCNVKTLNLLPNVLAAQKAEAEGCNETVFHRGETVTECSHSNCSILLPGGILKTHPNDCHILPGITKAHMFKACEKLGIPVDETAFTLEELRQADEVIITSSSNLCSFAETFEGKPVGGKAPALLKALQQTMIQEFLDFCGLKSL